MNMRLVERGWGEVVTGDCSCSQICQTLLGQGWAMAPGRLVC